MKRKQVQLKLNEKRFILASLLFSFVCVISLMAMLTVASYNTGVFGKSPANVIGEFWIEFVILSMIAYMCLQSLYFIYRTI